MSDQVASIVRAAQISRSVAATAKGTGAVVGGWKARQIRPDVRPGRSNTGHECVSRRAHMRPYRARPARGEGLSLDSPVR
jgi:hypothetical protein